jgi:GMP synthase (glutamine-hydrolysing)
MMCRWTTCGAERLDMPGAHPRHQHFAGRACYDVVERAWLKHFLDGWLSRVPDVTMAEAAE